jgi:hypothetical protein
MDHSKHRLKYYVSKCVHPVDFSNVIRVHENSQNETNYWQSIEIYVRKQPLYIVATLCTFQERESLSLPPLYLSITPLQAAR